MAATTTYKAHSIIGRQNQNFSMVERAMGESFGRLAPALQQFHRLDGHRVLVGEVRIHAPKSFFARLLARLLGTPLAASEGAIRFELDAQPTSETWTRFFPSHVMSSRLQLVENRIVENLGAARLRFTLVEKNAQLQMQLCRLQLFGVPSPRWLMPELVAEETGHGDRVQFQVRAIVPYIGLVAGYEGYLLLPKVASA